MPNFQYPKKIILRDLTVREGFQHEEKTIPLRAKLWLVEKIVGRRLRSECIPTGRIPKGHTGR
jgi:hypothetical protein